MIRPALILTRPLAQAEDFARAFRARFGADWPILLSPLTEIRFLDADLPTTGCDAIVFTSANAVEAFCRISPVRHLLALCVGPRTAAVARAAGFTVREGPGDAARLAAAIGAMGPGRIAWPRGTEAAVDVGNLLKLAGIETVSAVLYDQASCPPSPALRAALAGAEPLLLPLFSPGSAARAAAAMQGARAPILVAAMSPRVADAAAALSPTALAVAARPDAPAMLEALAALIAAGGSA